MHFLAQYSVSQPYSHLLEKSFGGGVSRPPAESPAAPIYWWGRLRQCANVPTLTWWLSASPAHWIGRGSREWKKKCGTSSSSFPIRSAGETHWNRWQAGSEFTLLICCSVSLLSGLALLPGKVATVLSDKECIINGICKLCKILRLQS